MRYKERICSKQKSQEIIQRLYKQVSVTYKTLRRLQQVLPGYLDLSSNGQRHLEMYVYALKDLERDLDAFPDDPPQ